MLPGAPLQVQQVRRERRGVHMESYVHDLYRLRFDDRHGAQQERHADLPPGHGDEWTKGPTTAQAAGAYQSDRDPTGHAALERHLDGRGCLPEPPPHFGDIFAGGDTPVFTTSSNVWVFQIGEALRTRHMAALMGLDLSMVTFSEHMSESRFRQRLGMAVHIPNFGLVLLAALTPPLRACLG